MLVFEPFIEVMKFKFIFLSNLILSWACASNFDIL